MVICLGSYASMPLTALRREAFELGYTVSRLLAKPDSNAKLAKGEKYGILSVPLHLAPASLSGFNVCSKATAGCKAACLHTAGNPAYLKGKIRARDLRTKLYFENRPLFLAWLIAEIAAHERKASRLGMLPAVRLNATSDIMWERVKIKTGKGTPAVTLFDMFRHVTFYDYTKIPNRRDVPSNYHLTFSLAENNDTDALLAHKKGFNVAVVFDVTRTHPLPEYFSLSGKILPITDGDVSDFRPNDPQGHIVGLRAKGDARYDKSGFVRCADFSLDLQGAE